MFRLKREGVGFANFQIGETVVFKRCKHEIRFLCLGGDVCTVKYVIQRIIFCAFYLYAFFLTPLQNFIVSFLGEWGVVVIIVN